MTWVAGVDGCKAGWIAAFCNIANATWHFRFALTIKEIVTAPEKPKIVAVDMPMGFLGEAERGGRLCEREARRILGERGCCVFSTPVRQALSSSNYEEALRANRASSQASIGFSIQAWGITPKLREVDRFLMDHSSLQSRVFEAHPELAFARLNGDKPVIAPKKDPAGKQARIALLASAGFIDFSSRWTEYRQANSLRRKHVADDDAIDALAVCVTAKRIESNEAHTLPIEPPLDALGIPMAIRY